MKLPEISNKIMVRAAVAMIFMTEVAFAWDTWWHIAVGRDNFWEPPHLMAQTGIILFILISFYSWHKTRIKAWLRVFLFSLIVPFSFPLDELWHRIFGVEDLVSILLVWSPPHILIWFGLFLSFISLLPLIKKDDDIVMRTLFGAFLFAGIVDLLFFLFFPLDVFGGWALLGFFGAGIMAFLMVGVFQFANKWMPSHAGAVFVAVIWLIIFGVFEFGRIDIASGVIVQPSEFAPPFLVVFGIMGAAIVMDLFYKLPAGVRGGISALVWSITIYGFAHYFFSLEFQYSLTQAGIAVISAMIGGALAAPLSVKLFTKLSK